MICRAMIMLGFYSILVNTEFMTDINSDNYSVNKI